MAQLQRRLYEQPRCPKSPRYDPISQHTGSHSEIEATLERAIGDGGKEILLNRSLAIYSDTI